MLKRRNKHKKQDPDFIIRYCNSKFPELSDLEGKTFDVEMYGRWCFMNRDQKVISGEQGYNQYRIFGGFYIRWGEFLVDKRLGCIRLVYEKGATIDKLRLDSDEKGVFNGLYCKMKKGKIVIISTFRLIERNADPAD